MRSMNSSHIYRWRKSMQRIRRVPAPAPVATDQAGPVRDIELIAGASQPEEATGQIVYLPL
jgi:hypothetical protein